MDNQKFELILFKVGEKFLQYILNYDKPIVRLNNIDEYNFQLNQLEVLDTLNLLIEKCEVLSSGNPHSTIKQYLFSFGNSFNQMRTYCGGNVSIRSQEEELLNYLLRKSTEFYPSLLISEYNQLLSNTTEIKSYFPSSLEEGSYIYKLLTTHSLLKNITSVEQEPTFSTVSYKLSNSSVVHCFLINFIEQFVVRSFLNCCYRIKYDLQSLLAEIEKQYLVLLCIAKRETVEISFFCGIYGLRLDGIEEYNLTENIILRNINETNNPGIKHTISIATTDTHSNSITGCTLEYKTILESLGKVNNWDYPITENNLSIYRIFDNLIHSHVLAFNSIYPPINITFFDKDMPLNRLFPQLIERKVGSISILTKDKLDKIREWFEVLDSRELKYVSLTLNRIKSSIYNRQYSIDSILDAFIAWESMFSSEISTTNSVVKSISKILQRTSYKISTTKLNELYSLRSYIVHGKPEQHKLIVSKYPENPFFEQEEIKKRVIEIATLVVRELILDSVLLKMTPEDRVKLLLMPTIYTCQQCDTKKYMFE